jgi:uncharacterized protein
MTLQQIDAQIAVVQQQISATDTMCGERPNGCSVTLLNLRDNCNDYFNCLDESERLRTQYTNQLAQLQAQRSAIATDLTPTIDPDLQNRMAEMESENQQSFLAKNKWWFIGGGVLIVGTLVTFLIIRKRK